MMKFAQRKAEVLDALHRLQKASTRKDVFKFADIVAIIATIEEKQHHED